MPQTIAASGFPRDPEKIVAAAAELDGFSALLEEHGVTVRRPSIEPNVGFRTPHFETSIANGLWIIYCSLLRAVLYRGSLAR